MPFSEQRPSASSDGLTTDQRRQLIDVARESIAHGLRFGSPLAVDPRHFPDRLREPQASFVTLRIAGALRGCIGSVEARRPLVNDVAMNAFGAAFHDPRFPPLATSEFPLLQIHISVLSPFEPLDFVDEEDLLARIRPGVDGLVLEYGPQRGLLLPSVWEDLPDRREFLRHLKMKAGLPPDFWDSGIRVSRFTSESFGDDDLPSR